MFFSEVILTLGRSRAVLEFLSAAKIKERSFRVFIAEGGPRLDKDTFSAEAIKQAYFLLRINIYCY